MQLINIQNIKRVMSLVFQSNRELGTILIPLALIC